MGGNKQKTKKKLHAKYIKVPMESFENEYGKNLLVKSDSDFESPVKHKISKVKKDPEFFKS